MYTGFLHRGLPTSVLHEPALPHLKTCIPIKLTLSESHTLVLSDMITSRVRCLEGIQLKYLLTSFTSNPYSSLSISLYVHFELHKIFLFFSHRLFLQYKYTKQSRKVVAISKANYIIRKNARPPGTGVTAWFTTQGNFL